MLYLPKAISDYIAQLTVDNRSPAYFCATKDGRLSSWGGKLSFYGFTNLQQGEYIDTQILFLAGLLPLNNFPALLPCVEMESGKYADVHLFSTSEGDWVLLLDATWDESQRSLFQQKGNTLSLNRYKQARLLEREFHHSAEILSSGFLHLLERGERRDVTIVLAKICGFNSYVDRNSPAEVINTLNSYIYTMMQPLLDAGGMVDKIMGDAIAVLFGVLPASESASDLAIAAALRMIEAVREIGKVRKADNSSFDIGVGITSGSVILGLIGRQSQKTFIATGYWVNLAERLGREASASEILIDENTFNQLSKMQDYFSFHKILEKELAQPIHIYSYLVK